MRTTTSTHPVAPVTGLASEVIPEIEVEHDWNNPKYPDVEVQLTGESSNAFALTGAVSRALRRHGVAAEEVDQFRVECLSGNYEQLIQTCGAWVNIS